MHLHNKRRPITANSMEKAFKFVATAIGWASNRGAGERESNTTATTNYNNQFETNNQHVSSSNGYNNNNTLSTSDIASKDTVETSGKCKVNGAIVGTTRRSRMFTASSISYANDSDSDGTPGHNHRTNNTKE